MSYLDPQGASERRGWEPSGDQREPEWTGADDPRPRPWPGGADASAYPGPAEQQTGFPYGGAATRYDAGAPYADVPSPYGDSSTAAYNDAPTTPYDTSGPYETRAPYRTAFRHEAATPYRPPAPDVGYEPVACEPSGHEPVAHEPSAYEPGGYEPGGYETGGYAPGPYQPVRHQPGGYRPDGHEYRSGPYPPGGYGPDPYRGPGEAPERGYRPDAGSSARPYPVGGAGEAALVAPTEPVGWPPVAADPSRSTGGRPPPADRVPPADPYADTQNLPRVGAAHPLAPPGPTQRPGPPTHPAGPEVRGPAEPAAGAERPAARASGTSRAGRNLPAAIGVGLALGALIVVPLFVYPPAFLVVVAAAAGIGTWELARAVRRGSGAEPPLPPLLGGGLLMVGLAWWAGPDALSLALLVTVLAALVWRLGDGPRGFQRDLTAAALIAVYVPFLGGFAALLTAEPGDGHLRVLVTLVAVVLSDTGGYAAGVTLGKHPMAPSVSPKKSWEGFAGSVVAAGAGSAVLLWLLLDVPPGWGAVFGVAVSVAAVLGDLGESMIKRDLGVKDMSNLLPGHGGVMDRLDSVLFAMPVAYLLLAIFVPTG